MSAALFADCRGEGDAPLVLLHGFAGSHRNWEGVRAHLPKTLPTIAYDLPGHAASLNAEGAGRAKSVSAAIAADLERRGVERFSLVGHSFGGAVAILLAVTAPERITALTLVAPGGMGPDINGDAMRARAVARREPEMRAALEPFYGVGKPLDPQILDEAIRFSAVPGQMDALCAMADGIARGNEQGAFPQALLERLTIPVSVVWGEDDAILPVSQSVSLPQRFSVRRIAGRGHMLPEEVPHMIARACCETHDSAAGDCNL